MIERDLLPDGLTVQPVPPPEPLTWDEMLALLPDPDRPVPARLEAGWIVAAHLRTTAKPAPPHWTSLGDLGGIPVVVDPDLPVGAWRIVDHDGNVMAEGNMFQDDRKVSET
jgi:hypothetical protein